jgi:hypothetical protein
MEIEGILAAIDEAFGCDRPVQMVRNPGHCDECTEHEGTMQAVTPETVSLDQVGGLAWDPVCYLTDEAWRYFVPGLARLALGRGDGSTSSYTASNQAASTAWMRNNAAPFPSSWIICTKAWPARSRAIRTIRSWAM